PERLRAGTTPAPLVFTDLQVGGARAAAGPQARTLAIPPEAEGSFAAEFSLLDFTAPERARYAYWLEGHDHGWREVDTAHRLASYTNLAPGRYRLHVKAADRDGNWTGQPVSLRIDVLPAWYQSWWFLGVKLLAAGLAVTAIVAVRLRLVRRRNAQLERLVGERTQELQRLQAQLEELAYSDALTGLPNRRMFGDWCRNFIAAAQRRRGGFALLLIDLDHFKQVNDTRGHDAGDALLVETARRLRGVARRSDVVARLGGDEFAMLLADAADRALAEATCRRILEAFAEPAELPGGAAIRVTPSIGVALFPVDGTTQDALYKSADLALYEAKAGGRNTWRFARP
ncbi:MAG TPA: GGDEF domain-containing protein, partial [Burkholderiaceae bacterium]